MKGKLMENSENQALFAFVHYYEPVAWIYVKEFHLILASIFSKLKSVLKIWNPAFIAQTSNLTMAAYLEGHLKWKLV